MERVDVLLEELKGLNKDSIHEGFLTKKRGILNEINCLIKDLTESVKSCRNHEITVQIKLKSHALEGFITRSTKGIYFKTEMEGLVKEIEELLKQIEP